MTKLDDYAQKFETIRFRREEGILEMTLHTNGGSQRFGPVPHAEMEQAFLDVSRDPDNQVIILTGTGEEFSGPAVASSVGRAVPKLTPEQWMKLGSEAKRFTMNMLAIEVPMIAAVNGPALRHPEVPLMCDIVLAAEQAAFQDSAHFRGGMVPGDGVHVVFPMLMGLNRARYFLLTAQLLSAKEALGFGLVNEVLPREQLMSRAWELARQILQQPVINRRYTRVILNEYLRRPMNDLLGYGLALEGLGIVQ
ncbi:MAG: crotonase [Betaproteobacteria bacterium SG8_41]|jgi:enoyl-CoA hydratase/carnithine racemase|nr:MAG: crotonase [Betaproteobacteria bacterium SG8_41]